MRRKFFLAIITCLVIFLSSLGSISATLNVSLSDQGTDAKYKSNGSVINNGNLEITIYDALTGGNLIYNETFTGVINNGTWNVMLGENNYTLNFKFFLNFAYRVLGATSKTMDKCHTAIRFFN